MPKLIYDAAAALDPSPIAFSAGAPGSEYRFT